MAAHKTTRETAIPYPGIRISPVPRHSTCLYPVGRICTQVGFDSSVVYPLQFSSQVSHLRLGLRFFSSTLSPSVSSSAAFLFPLPPALPFASSPFFFPPTAPLASSSGLTSPATGPVFFCTLGTTQLVRPPTVRNVIFAPLGSVPGASFFPFPHR